MPRYYFRITDGKQVLEADSREGLELPGNAAARDEARRFALELKQGRIIPGRKWDGWFVRIVDGHGHEVDTISIDLAAGEPPPPLT